jgi:hypothetical protein
MQSWHFPDFPNNLHRSGATNVAYVLEPILFEYETNLSSSTAPQNKEISPCGSQKETKQTPEKRSGQLMSEMKEMHSTQFGQVKLFSVQT